MTEKPSDKNAEKRARQDECAKQVIERTRQRQEKRKSSLPLFLAVSGWLLKMLSKSRYQNFQNDVQTIREAFSNYLNDKNSVLNLTGMVNSHKLAEILIGHIVQNEPGIFDKTIKDPEMVTDPETLTYIINAYLKHHPDAGMAIIEKCKPSGYHNNGNDKRSEIFPSVYAKARLYAQRSKDDKLRHNEK